MVQTEEQTENIINPKNQKTGVLNLKTENHLKKVVKRPKRARMNHRMTSLENLTMFTTKVKIKKTNLQKNPPKNRRKTQKTGRLKMGRLKKAHQRKNLPRKKAYPERILNKNIQTTKSTFPRAKTQLTTRTWTKISRGVFRTSQAKVMTTADADEPWTRTGRPERENPRSRNRKNGTNGTRRVPRRVRSLQKKRRHKLSIPRTIKTPKKRIIRKRRSQILKANTEIESWKNCCEPGTFPDEI